MASALRDAHCDAGDIQQSLQELLAGFSAVLPLRVRLVLARKDEARSALFGKLTDRIVQQPAACLEVGVSELLALLQKEPWLLKPGRSTNAPHKRGAPTSSSFERPPSPKRTAPVPGATAPLDARWLLRPVRTYNGRGRADITPATQAGLQLLELQGVGEWLSLPPFAPRWGADSVKSCRQVKLNVEIHAPLALEELRTLDSWAKQKMAETSDALLGETLSLEEIDEHSLYVTVCFW